MATRLPLVDLRDALGNLGLPGNGPDNQGEEGTVIRDVYTKTMPKPGLRTERIHWRAA